MSSMQLETSSRYALYLHVSTLEWLGAVCPCGVCKPNGTAGRIWTFPKAVDTWAHQPASNPLRVELQGVSPKGISPCLSPAGWPAVANQKIILSEDLWPQQKIRTYVFGHFLGKWIGIPIQLWMFISHFPWKAETTVNSAEHHKFLIHYRCWEMIISKN